MNRENLFDQLRELLALIPILLLIVIPLLIRMRKLIKHGREKEVIKKEREEEKPAVGARPVEDVESKGPVGEIFPPRGAERRTVEIFPPRVAESVSRRTVQKEALLGIMESAAREEESLQPAKRPPSPPEGRPEGISRVGWKKLETLSPLKRAVVWAEILGSPRGLSEERRV